MLMLRVERKGHCPKWRLLKIDDVGAVTDLGRVSRAQAEALKANGMAHGS